MKEGGGGGEERKVSSLSSPPHPRLLAPFFVRPLLRNSAETLASQATFGFTCCPGFPHVNKATRLLKKKKNKNPRNF